MVPLKGRQHLFKGCEVLNIIAGAECPLVGAQDVAETRYSWCDLVPNGQRRLAQGPGRDEQRGTVLRRLSLQGLRDIT